jgi:hypothetical protein
MSREALDALEAWHTTTRALRDATPWTAEWVRLRMIAQEQRAAYEALVGATSEAPASAESGTDSETVGSSGVRPPGAASS